MLCCGGCVALNRADPVDPRPILRNRPGAGAMVSELVVATYNVHGASQRELATAFADDPRLRRADVVFLQEFESDPATLATTLDRSVAYAPGYQRSKNSTHGVAIASRFPLRDLRVIELPRYRVVVNSARRIALRATIDLTSGPIHLYSVHLDNRINPGDRKRQLAPVLADADALPRTPAIIAGDMNTSPFCWIGNVIPVPCGRQDDCVERSVREHGFDTPVTASGATSQWGMRLDAIYTRSLDIAAFGVSDIVHVSDHLPLWAVVVARRSP